METKKELLNKLVHFKAPIAELIEKLGNFGWDEEDYLVVLTRAEISNAIKLFLNKKITDNELENWAGCVEMRDGIEYEAGQEEIIADVLFELSTPEINPPIDEENLNRILERLNQISS